MPKTNKTELSEFKRRSKAARKGWKTRKKRAGIEEIRVERNLIDNAIRAKGKKKKPNPRIGDWNTNSEIKRELAKTKKQLAKLEEELAQEVMLKGFVDSRSPEYLHRDFTIAAHPCRLRHVTEAPALRRTMREARKKGQIPFERIAHDIADHYDMPVREVFTLFWSP